MYFYLNNWSVFFSFVVLTTNILYFYFAYLEMARFECDKQFTKILLQKTPWTTFHKWWVNPTKDTNATVEHYIVGKPQHIKLNQGKIFLSKETGGFVLIYIQSIIMSYFLSFGLFFPPDTFQWKTVYKTLLKFSKNVYYPVHSCLQLSWKYVIIVLSEKPKL